jgi:uncharacterized protein YjbJ (UPF0337 family)
MNIDTLTGEGTSAKGRIKQSIGEATGDPALQNEGAADQFSGTLRQALGAVRDFARAQPLLTAVVAGLVGSALFARSRSR